MATTTATLTVRIDPTLEEALRTASQQEHRSTANVVEVRIQDRSGRDGVEIAGTATATVVGRVGKSAQQVRDSINLSLLAAHRRSCPA